MPQWSDQFPWYIKQPIDQAAHFAATFAAVWVWSLLWFQFIGVTGATLFACFVVVWAAVYREIVQMGKREKVKLGDTILDLLFLVAGTWMGCWTFLRWMG